MRDPKYKAFLKSGNYPHFHIGEIYEVFGFNKYSGTDVVHIVTTDECRISVERKDVHLMQYTGVDDKNNLEIYENHILKCESQNHIGIVWFTNGAFMTDCEGFGDHPISQTHPDDLEIIGNTLQNSKILED